MHGPVYGPRSLHIGRAGLRIRSGLPGREREGRRLLHPVARRRERELLAFYEQQGVPEKIAEEADTILAAYDTTLLRR